MRGAVPRRRRHRREGGGGGAAAEGGAEGVYDPAAGLFRAASVLARHDETYMPKEVADALKKQGLWKP